MAPATNTDQTFEFDIMAVVIQALQESGTILGEKHYALMAAVDGKRSKSAFQHLFRNVKARAKDIGDKISTGEINVGTTPIKTKAKAGGDSKPTTPASAKRGSKRKARSEMPSASQSDNAECAQNEDDEEDGKTPTKKVKVVQQEEEFFT